MNPAIHNKWYVEPEPQEETESWLLTYLDMITLLLVLLVAMLTLSGQVPKSPPMPVTTGVLPAHNGLFPGQAELAAAPEALPPEALPAPLSTPPVQKQPLASLDEPGADSFLSGAPDYVLGETDSDAILKHVMAQADEPQAPAGVAADPLPAAVLPQAEPPALVAPVLPELGDDIQIIRNKESIRFSINSELLYSSGKADLSLAGLAVMGRLVPGVKDSGD